VQRILPNAKRIVIIAGNHEHYDGVPIEQAHDTMRLQAELTMGKVIFLENDYAWIAAGRTYVCIFGCTLWTDYKLDGRPMEGMGTALNGMYDHVAIRDEEGRFTPEKAGGRHAESVKFLDEALSQTFFGPVVVMTHHLPSAKCIHPQYENSMLNPAFASNLDHLVDKATLWVHGHTHSPVLYSTETGSLVVSNPSGYPRENPNFNEELIIGLYQEDGKWKAWPQ
jgi:DNA repair exonuclease SbcCD nuclease subunit